MTSKLSGTGTPKESISGSGTKTIFISYAWGYKPKLIHRVAFYIRECFKENGYEIWLDTLRMHGNPSDAMAKGINESVLVIPFISQAYANSENCKSELAFAKFAKKPLLFVDIQRLTPEQNKGWLRFEAITNFPFQFRVPTVNRQEELIEEIRRKLEGKSTIPMTMPEGPVADESDQLKPGEVKLLNIPNNNPYPLLGQFIKEADDLRLKIKNMTFEKEPNLLVIRGPHGVGKTVFVSKVFLENQDFLMQTTYRVDFVVWVNAKNWACNERQLSAEAADRDFEANLIDEFKKHAEITSRDRATAITIWPELEAYAERLQLKFLILIDDAHSQIADICKRHNRLFNGKKGSLFSYVLITSDEDTEVTVDALMDCDNHKLPLWTDDELFEMMWNYEDLKTKLEEPQVRNLASQCCGLPYIARVFSSYFKLDRRSKSDLQAIYRNLLDQLSKSPEIDGDYDEKIKSAMKCLVYTLETGVKQLKIWDDFTSLFLFSRARYIGRSDAALLWNCKEDEAWTRLTNLNRFSLVSTCKVDPTTIIRGIGKPICRDQRECVIIPDLMFITTTHYLKNLSKRIESLSKMKSEILDTRRSSFILFRAVDSPCGMEFLADLFGKPLNLSVKMKETSERLVKVYTLPEDEGQLLRNRTVNAEDVEISGLLSQTTDKRDGKPFLLHLWQKGAREMFNQCLWRLFDANLSGPHSRTIFSSFTSMDKERNCALIEIRKSLGETKTDDELGRTFWKFLLDMGAMGSLYEIDLRLEVSKVDALKFAVRNDSDYFRRAKDKDVFSVDQTTGFTSLMAASLFGYDKIVDSLVSRNNRPPDYVLTSLSKNNKTALNFAAAGGHLSILKKLPTANDGGYFLHDAAEANQVEIVEAFKDNDFAKEASGPKKRLPVFRAARRGLVYLVDMLDGGYETSGIDAKGRSIVFYAAKSGHEGLLRILHAKPTGDLFKRQDDEGCNALFPAAASGNLAVVQFLVKEAKLETNLRKTKGDNCTAIFEAARRDHLEVVKFLYKLPGGEKGVRNGLGQKVPFVAAFHGSKQVFEFYVSEDRECVNQQDDKGRSALYLAVQTGSIDTVRYLLQQGSSVGVLDNDCRSVLFPALENNNDEILKMLLADPNLPFSARDKETGKTVLHLAIERGKTFVIDQVLQANDAAVFNVSDNEGRTPIFIAVASGQTNIVKKLLEKSDLEIRDHNNKTVLHAAAQGGNAEVVKDILAKVPSSLIGAVDSDGWAAIFYNCLGEKYNREVCTLMKNKGLSLEASQQKVNGPTPLVYAVLNNNTSLLRNLVKEGANANTVTEDGRTALNCACQKGDLASIELLVNAGADVFLSGSADNPSPVFFAIEMANSQMLAALLKSSTTSKGINQLNRTNRTAFLAAVELDRLDMVKMLAEKGANRNAEYPDGWNAAFVAAKNAKLTQNGAILSYLTRDLRVDVNAANKQTGITPLLKAIEDNDAALLEVLVKYGGVRCDLPDADGKSPLQRAATSDAKAKIVEFLLKCSGVNVNQLDKQRQPPLMTAILSNAKEIVKILVKTEGIDLTITDAEGWDALFYAAQVGREDFCEQLRMQNPALNLDKVNVKKNETALSFAIKSGSLELVRKVVFAGKANIKAIFGPRRDTALLLAVAAANDEIAEYCIENDVLVSATDIDGWSALYYAAVNDQQKIVDRLKAKGADINQRNEKTGLTPVETVMAADNEKNGKMLENLLKHGAYLEGDCKSVMQKLIGENRRNLLVAVAKRYKAEAFEMCRDAILMANDISVLSSFGSVLREWQDPATEFNLAMIAADRGKRDAVKLLIFNLTVPVSHVDKQQRNICQIAAEAGQLEIIDDLKEFCKPQMRAKDTAGKYPVLESAKKARENKAEMVAKVESFLNLSA